MTTYCIWKKTTILLLQFAKNGMSISSKLRPQEEVKNVSSKRNTLYSDYWAWDATYHFRQFFSNNYENFISVHVPLWSKEGNFSQFSINFYWTYERGLVIIDISIILVCFFSTKMMGTIKIHFGHHFSSFDLKLFPSYKKRKCNVENRKNIFYFNQSHGWQPHCHYDKKTKTHDNTRTWTPEIETSGSVLMWQPAEWTSDS